MKLNEQLSTISLFLSSCVLLVALILVLPDNLGVWKIIIGAVSGVLLGSFDIWLIDKLIGEKEQ